MTSGACVCPRNCAAKWLPIVSRCVTVFVVASLLHSVASVAIQRLLRGHFARVRARREAERKAEAEADGVVNHLVVMVQKVFRGFRSRKYRHDYYARKSYINDVQKKGEALCADMRAERERQIKVCSLLCCSLATKPSVAWKCVRA